MTTAIAYKFDEINYEIEYTFVDGSDIYPHRIHIYFLNNGKVFMIKSSDSFRCRTKL